MTDEIDAEALIEAAIHDLASGAEALRVIATTIEARATRTSGKALRHRYGAAGETLLDERRRRADRLDGSWLFAGLPTDLIAKVANLGGLFPEQPCGSAVWTGFQRNSILFDHLSGCSLQATFLNPDPHHVNVSMSVDGLLGSATQPREATCRDHEPTALDRSARAHAARRPADIERGKQRQWLKQRDLRLVGLQPR